MENQVPAAPQKNGLAVAGLVLGILALVFDWIPLINVLAWPLAILALIFGIIGVIGNKPKKGMAIAAIILGGLSIAGYFIAYALLFAAASALL